MTEHPVIVDAGPLVAFMVQEEEHHAWAVERFRDLPAPLLTCEPVLAEAAYKVLRLPNGRRRFFGLLDGGSLKVAFDLMPERASLERLVHKYADAPMSLADACLVRMNELHGGAVFTLDGHFRFYRRHGREAIPVIMPS